MIDRKDQPWPSTEAEALELWRKRVKNDWLRLRLAGRDDSDALLLVLAVGAARTAVHLHGWNKQKATSTKSGVEAGRA